MPMNLLKNKPSPGEIVKLLLREISLVTRPANGRPLLELKDQDTEFKPVDGFEFSKDILKELEACGLDVADLYFADSTDAVSEDLEKAIPAAAFQLVSAMVALEQVIKSIPEAEELEKAGVPKGVQRKPLMKLMKDIADSLIGMLRKAGFVGEDEIINVKVSEDGSEETSKGKEGDDMPLSKEDLEVLQKGISDSITTALTASLAGLKDALTPAHVVSDTDSKIAQLEQTAKGLSDQIAAELVAANTQTETTQQVTSLTKGQEDQGARLQVLEKQISDQTAELERVRKLRIGGLGQPDPAASNNEPSEAEILKAAERMILGGNNIIGSASNEFRGRLSV